MVVRKLKKIDEASDSIVTILPVWLCPSCRRARRGSLRQINRFFVGRLRKIRVNPNKMRSKMKRSYSTIMFVFLVVASFLLLAVNGESQAAPKTTIKWGTAAAGSAGYVTLFGLAKIINDNTPDIDIEVIPTGGSTASQRMFSRGELGGIYSGAWSLVDIYKNTGPFEKTPYPSTAVKPYQTFYTHLVSGFWVTKADRTDIKNWRDLAGKSVFMPAPGSSTFLIPQKALTVLGIGDKVKISAVPQSTLADAVSMGTVDAVFAYTSGTALLPWAAEVDARCKLKIVLPTPEEEKTIRTIPNIAFTSVDLKAAFSQDVGAERSFAMSDYYGFHVGKNISAEDAYTIIKILVEKADQVAKVHALLTNFAKDPLGMQISAMSSVSEIPVHPGIAKYLKEKGVWKEGLKIGGM
jgi:uncharacterized protein